MTRVYIICDICGSKWEITNTEYANKPYPGTRYIRNCVKEDRRNIIIQKGKSNGYKLERYDMDICDRCYRMIDRFIFDLKEGKEDANLKKL